MKKFFLSSAAEQDIDDLVSYIAAENTHAALNLLDKIYETMDMLATNPLIGHKRDDLTEKPVRFWALKWDYLIIYKVCSPIEIVRVLSGYRDIINLLN